LHGIDALARWSPCRLLDNLITVWVSDTAREPRGEQRDENMNVRDGIIALGLALGYDPRDSAKRAFYRKASEFLPKEAEKLKKEAEKLSVAGVAKKLGLTQSDAAKLPEGIASKAFPKGATIVRMVNLERRFPDAPIDVSLEVYATAAAKAMRDAKAIAPEGKEIKREAMDAEALTMVAEATTAMRDAGTLEASETMSIRNARDAWQEGKKRPAANDHAESVGDKVEWLLSQPAAIVAYVNDDDDNRGKVADLIAILTAATTVA
jgi:hypothetical protein